MPHCPERAADSPRQYVQGIAPALGRQAKGRVLPHRKGRADPAFRSLSIRATLASRLRGKTLHESRSVMSEQRPKVVVVGEAIIELVRGGDGRFALGCAGDTFNVAVYLARSGMDAAFATALGEDPYSEAVLALAAAQGIASDLVLRMRGRLPGLTVIDADASGAHRAHDWRGEAPARELFELPDWGRLADGLTKAKLVYFSGITLSLYSNNGLGRFLAVIETIRQQGVKIAFDGNFRPRGWRGDLPRTRTVFMEALKRVDMALPAYDDEAVLWGGPSPEATGGRVPTLGV